MNALWLENQQLSYRTDVTLPLRRAGEALVRVHLAGVCNTDLELVKGYYSFSGIPGHEFVGVVTDADDSTWIGRRVVGEINAACGDCFNCRAGRPTHCERRTVLGILNRWGAFAEYLTLPLQNLHPVPDHISDEAAVFTEPLAAALEIQQQVQIHPADRVLVIGAGRLGMLIAFSLALTGCDLHVVVRHAWQQEMLSAQHIKTLRENEIPQRCMDLVVDAAGTPDGFHLAHKAVRPRGVLALKSTYHGPITVDFSAIVVDEITLIGSRCGPFEPALRLMAKGLVDPRPLIAARYPLAGGIAAFEYAARPGVLKVLLRF